MIEILDGFMPDLNISFRLIINPAEPIIPARNTGIMGIRYLSDDSEKNMPASKETSTNQMALLTTILEIASSDNSANLPTVDFVG